MKDITRDNYIVSAKRLSCISLLSFKGLKFATLAHTLLKYENMAAKWLSEALSAPDTDHTHIDNR